MVWFSVPVIMLQLIIEYFLFVIDALPRVLQKFVWGTIGEIQALQRREEKFNYRWSCTGLVGGLYLACTFTR